MKSIITDAFTLTKNNLMLLQPLILYMLIMSFAVLPLKNLQANSIPFFLVLINLGLVTTAFCSGWFGMIKKTVIDEKNKAFTPEKTKAEYSLELLKEFFPSVGSYFLWVTFAFLIFSILGFGFSLFLYKTAIHIFTNQELITQMFNNLMQPVEIQQKFLASLSNEDLISLNKCIIFFAFSYFIFNLITMFYMPALMFKTKNPFKALFLSICAAIKHPFLTAGIYFYLMISGFIISAIGILGNLNLLFSLITLFITIMFFTYYIMVLFLGYERLYNSNNGSDSERENSTFNRTC